MKADTDLIKKWGRIILVNLAIVALFGLCMRYKIAFNFPWLDQKNLLHAHSHFAFAGWITQFIYVGMAAYILPQISSDRKRQYRWLLTINMLIAYGMLLSFTIQGYKAVSIVFSTVSILISVLFLLRFYSDTGKYQLRGLWIRWALAGLSLNVLSAAGPLYLAYMIATKTVDPDLYLGSIYYYLHFQYNGWFFFGAMSLLSATFQIFNKPIFKIFFLIFAFTVIPAFFLSILWAELPGWLYILTVVATFFQMTAWFLLAQNIVSQVRKQCVISLKDPVHVLFLSAGAALSIKFFLQTLSVIPSLSQLVFGFRPIVIAYLHLVLLGVYTLFILGWLFSKADLPLNKMIHRSAGGFLAGVIFNELLLAIQGFAAFAYFPVPYINELLLMAAAILFVSATGISLALGSRSR